MNNNILILAGLGGLIYFFNQKKDEETKEPQPEEIIITPQPQEIITPQPQEIITPKPEETIDINDNPKLWSIDNIKRLLQKYKYVIVGGAIASTFLAISGYKVYKYFNQVEKDKYGFPIIKEVEIENEPYIIKKIDISELGQIDITFSKSQKLVNAYGSLMVLQQEVKDIGFEKTADKLADILNEENNGFYQNKRYEDFINFVINNYGDHLKN